MSKLRVLVTTYDRSGPDDEDETVDPEQRGNDDLVADMGGLGVSALGRAAPLLAAGNRRQKVGSPR